MGRHLGRRQHLASPEFEGRRVLMLEQVGDLADGQVVILGHRAFPRLRLRGIDTGEVYTQAGRRARDVVTTVLAQVDLVVIATRRTDSYGRYLADVKYLLGADPQTVLARGTYLNRQRLDQGLARRYYG